MHQLDRDSSAQRRIVIVDDIAVDRSSGSKHERWTNQFTWASCDRTAIDVPEAEMEASTDAQRRGQLRHRGPKWAVNLLRATT